MHVLRQRWAVNEAKGNEAMDNEKVRLKTRQDESDTAINDVDAARPSGSHDDSIAAKDDDNTRCFVPFWGLVIYIMGFLGFLCSFTFSASLSVTIVAMVNHTALAEDVETTNVTNVRDTVQCPRDPALQRADGEFTWNRQQQAATLAAIQYGTAITQVRGFSREPVLNVAENVGVAFLYGTYSSGERL